MIPRDRIAMTEGRNIFSVVTCISKLPSRKAVAVCAGAEFESFAFLEPLCWPLYYMFYVKVEASPFASKDFW